MALACAPASRALRTWDRPGDAWRIIFIGTAAEARGRNVASALYRNLMADRSLVARIALDNVASIRLHQSAGWSLYRDGGVVLAVHVRQPAHHSGRAATG
jgi:ribosomal protein S18 acetylase RimI-like enzyme